MYLWLEDHKSVLLITSGDYIECGSTVINTSINECPIQDIKLLQQRETMLSSSDILREYDGAILASRLVTARCAAARPAATPVYSKQGGRRCSLRLA